MPLSVPSTGGDPYLDMAYGQFEYDTTGAVAVLTGENYFFNFDNIGVTINGNDTLSFPTGIYQFQIQTRNSIRRNQLPPPIPNFQSALILFLGVNGSSQLYVNNPNFTPYADIDSPTTINDAVVQNTNVFVYDYVAGDQLQPNMIFDSANASFSPFRQSLRIWRIG